MPFTDAEGRLLTLLLAGDHPAMRVLRAQAEVATPARREVRNGGRLLEFAIPDSAARLTADSVFIHDVHVERPGHAPVEGTVTLMVVDGAIWVLSLPDWPELDEAPGPGERTSWTAGYLAPVEEAENGWQRWVPVSARDLAWFDAALAESEIRPLSGR
jgi:hypothetical protein